MNNQHEIILLNIYGNDKPGLTSSLTQILANYNVNILEIGMEDGKILPHQVRDPSATEEMGGRDPQRTPMQWDATKN